MTKMKDISQKTLTFALIAVFFLVLSYAFVPQVLGGKIVNQSDISGYVGMAHEMNEWNAAHPDDPTSWTDSMFGGMPTTTISAPRRGDWTQAIYDALLTGKRPATYLFISLVGAFLLMLSLGVGPLVAAGGAVAVTFCSYNMQIIQVGHNTKMQAIAFLPWALAAFIFTYRTALKDAEGKSRKRRRAALTVLGAVLFAFAVSFQVKANHQQITYYLALMLVIYASALLIYLLCDKERRGLIGRFFAASALLLVLGCAGIATNANKLIPVYKYTAQSMRGGSELQSASNAESGGLEMDYATAWSYGWEELPNLLIPNFNGGSSAGAVNPAKSQTYAILKQAGYSDLKTVAKNLPLYWGPQPFTAGPMYMGAITIFLFILGLFFCEPKDKWWVVVCALLAVFLGLGSNFMPFTRFFYDHMPFYNKFRTVSMALVMLQTLLPVLGFVALDRIVKGGVSREEFKKKGPVAFAIAGCFCLLFVLIPSLAGSFSAASDSSMPEVLTDALRLDRLSLLRSDALRSLLLITASYVLLVWGFSIPKDAQKTFSEGTEAALARRRTAALLVCLLVLADLFTVGKRYLGADDFVTPRTFNSQFAAREVDKIILEDKDPSYRVLDLSVSTFNDSHASYWHKSVGGYSPAKLQRYQELIERYLSDEINDIFAAAKGVSTVGELEDAMPRLPILSALNTRYLILGADMMPVVNGGALGSAWIAAGVDMVETPDEALSEIGEVDLRTIAVLENVPEEKLSAVGGPVPGDTVSIVSYAPNELHYHYNVAGPRLAVFSEVYYPEGWHAWVEDTGEDVEVLRADWILRAAVLPQGEHDLVMRFDPPSVSVSASISRASSIAIILLLLLSVGGAVLARKEND